MREKERERLSEDQGERVCVRDKNIIKAEENVTDNVLDAFRC